MAAQSFMAPQSSQTVASLSSWYWTAADKTRSLSCSKRGQLMRWLVNPDMTPIHVSLWRCCASAALVVTCLLHTDNTMFDALL